MIEVARMEIPKNLKWRDVFGTCVIAKPAQSLGFKYAFTMRCQYVSYSSILFVWCFLMSHGQVVDSEISMDPLPAQPAQAFLPCFMYAKESFVA